MSAIEPRQMNLGVFAVGNGNHVAGWRHPGAAKSGDDIGNYVDIAQRAEAAAMDLVFFADNVRCDLDDHPGFVSRTEPFTTLSAVAMCTRRIGLVASGSTSYTEPYNLARLVGSLDHISSGRAGWNLVTTNTPLSAENFGVEPITHDERYEVASEYIEVVKGLWDGWEPDAKVMDVESGRFFDPDKVHDLGHRGKHFSVRGPLNMSRCPQGQPVIFQAGSSRAGQAFAARHADVVLAVQVDRARARAFYASLKRDVAAGGRDPGHCKILPGFLPVVGGTETEAKAKLTTLASYVDESVGFRTMTDRIGHDFSQYPLDGPIPDLPLSAEVQGYARMMLTPEYRAKHTLRDLYNNFAVSRGYLISCGTPEQIADTMEAWFAGGACDGFVVAPAHFPEALDDFTRNVLPVLRARGLFRTEYRGSTLRDHLGLPVPVNRHARG